MSLVTSLQRIKDAKADIKAAIESKGVSVGSGLIDTYADKIREIKGEETVVDDFSFISQNGTRAAGLFHNMTALTKVPANCTFKQPTSFENMFYNCYALTEAPQLDTSRATSVRCMFRETHSLRAVPDYETAAVKDFARMFNVSAVVYAPDLDTSSGTNFYGMFASDPALQKLPAYDLQSGRDFSYMFNYCQNVQNTEELVYHVWAGQMFQYMFNYCRTMQVAPSLYSWNGKAFHYMFADCYQLHTIPYIALGSAVERCYDYNNLTVYPCFEGMFLNCYNLQNITISGGIKYDISFSSCSKLTRASLLNIIEQLVQTTTPRYLGLSKASQNLLSDSEKAVIIAKGWKIH